ncbi:MAG: glycine--tRNA ligase subunit alpha [Acidobacteriota bacterium]
MTTETTLQGVIDQLTSFWHRQGCAVLPPCSFEVPLGLLHPEAFFRLLDPGPWRAAFVQPISRPADARGGAHPYRVARHLQLQVAWKDIDPRRPRDLMVESLRDVGFELEHHDLRFVDQRLQIEAGDVEGRGWRVMLDGLRLGRITYLEKIAGAAPSRPSVELSYGVELVAMARTGAADVFSVPWLAAVGTGGGADEPGRDKRREGEEELHRYAFDVADVGALRRSLDDLAGEAERCLAADLPRIAYEQAMRMLPLLDLLETRGDLSYRERVVRLGVVRDRVNEAARAYLASIDGASESADSVGEDSEER